MPEVPEVKSLRLRVRIPLWAKVFFIFYIFFGGPSIILGNRRPGFYLRKYGTCILALSGQPCRDVLEFYTQHSIISQFIIEIDTSIDLLIVAIIVTNITTNCAIVRPMNIIDNAIIIMSMQY
uniref:Uncharacterized protein n=1 Tax=Amphimedon queenslandica TaxID=400682 RepID=A0A1X7UC62_AMPQE